MRVRDGDGPHATELANGSNGGVVEQRDAVPQQVATGRSHQQGALADGEARLRADAGQPEVLADLVDVVTLQLIQRAPLLARPADVLALVFADVAARRRRAGWSELHAAGHADVRGGSHTNTLAADRQDHVSGLLLRLYVLRRRDHLLERIHGVDHRSVLTLLGEILQEEDVFLRVNRRQLEDDLLVAEPRRPHGKGDVPEPVGGEVRAAGPQRAPAPGKRLLADRVEDHVVCLAVFREVLCRVVDRPAGPDPFDELEILGAAASSLPRMRCLGARTPETSRLRTITTRPLLRFASRVWQSRRFTVVA